MIRTNGRRWHRHAAWAPLLLMLLVTAAALAGSQRQPNPTRVAPGTVSRSPDTDTVLAREKAALLQRFDEFNQILVALQLTSDVARARIELARYTVDPLRTQLLLDLRQRHAAGLHSRGRPTWTATVTGFNVAMTPGYRDGPELLRRDRLRAGRRQRQPGRGPRPDQEVCGHDHRAAVQRRRLVPATRPSRPGASMLTSKRWGAALVILAATAAAVLTTATPAWADYVYCPPTGGDCYVVATAPGSTGGGGSTGGSDQCHLSEQLGARQVPCYDPDFGWFNPSGNCYFKLYQPAPGELAPPPPGSAYYVATCPYTATPWPVPTIVGPTMPPAGYGRPARGILAVEAIDKMALRGPDISIAPSPNGGFEVGLVATHEQVAR